MCTPYGCFKPELVSPAYCLQPMHASCNLLANLNPWLVLEMLLPLKFVPRALLQLSGERSAMVGHFAGYLHNVFHPSTDEKTLEVAANTMGHLVRVGGPLTADVVEFEVRSPPFTFSCKSQYSTRLATAWWDPQLLGVAKCCGLLTTCSRGTLSA